MIDDILTEIFGEAIFGRGTPSKRAQLLARLFFGLLGALLCGAGAVLFYRRYIGLHTPTTMSMIAVFVFLASFCLFNIALARTWRWPGVMFVVSFAFLFVSRLAFGP